MTDYIFLMHGDDTVGEWSSYIEGLAAKGVMRGGSAIGDGVCVRKGEPETRNITDYIRGYIKVEAESLEAAKALLPGNPVYEAGGVIEIRELPRTD